MPYLLVKAGLYLALSQMQPLADPCSDMQVKFEAHKAYAEKQLEQASRHIEELERQVDQNAIRIAESGMQTKIWGTILTLLSASGLLAAAVKRRAPKE